MPNRGTKLKATVDVPCFVGSALYAKLSKQFDCEGMPANDMQIAFQCRRVRSGKDAENYRRLVTAVANSTGIVTVESFVYYPDAKVSADRLLIVAMPCVDDEEAKVAAYVGLMRDYYGFAVELF